MYLLFAFIYHLIYKLLQMVYSMLYVYLKNHECLSHVTGPYFFYLKVQLPVAVLHNLDIVDICIWLWL